MVQHVIVLIAAISSSFFVTTVCCLASSTKASVCREKLRFSHCRHHHHAIAGPASSKSDLREFLQNHQYYHRRISASSSSPKYSFCHRQIDTSRHLSARSNDNDGDDLSNDNSDSDDEAINSSSGTSVTVTAPTETTSYFGVGEKSLEFRELIESSTDQDDVDMLCVPADDLIDVPNAKEQVECAVIDTVDAGTKTTAASSSLSPSTILKFISPTLALWIAPPIMSLIDTSVVGQYCGSTELAALNPGCTLIDSSAYLFMFLATAATNMVTSVRANDNNDNNSLDNDAQDRIVSEALFLALCSGIGLATLVFVAGRPLLFAIAGQESAQVVPGALRYSLIRAFGQPFVVMASVARAASLASKDTRGPLLSVVLAFALNAAGTIALVRLTKLGIMGAAIGTLGADICATLFLLARLQKSRNQQQKERTRDNEKSVSSASSPKTDGSASRPLFVIPTMANFKIFLQYAAPIFFTILGKSVVYNGIAISVGRMGAVALAAHQVLLRNFFFWTPIGDSVGMTSQVFLPGILAEERSSGVTKRGAKRLLFGIGVLAGIIAGALAGLLPSQGYRLFTTSTHVATALKRTAPILALCVSMHAIALTCEGMLLAQRDLGFLSNSYVVTTFITCAILLSPMLRPKTLAGSWWILALFQGSRAIQFAFRTLWISRRREMNKGLVSSSS